MNVRRRIYAQYEYLKQKKKIKRLSVLQRFNEAAKGLQRRVWNKLNLCLPNFTSYLVSLFLFLSNLRVCWFFNHNFTILFKNVCKRRFERNARRNLKHVKNMQKYKIRIRIIEGVSKTNLFWTLFYKMVKKKFTQKHFTLSILLACVYSSGGFHRFYHTPEHVPFHLSPSYALPSLVH